MKIIYRISDTGYNKVKPPYINNENCLKNAIQTFSPFEYHWLVIADNVSENTYNMLDSQIGALFVQRVSVGHGAGTFNLALNHALTLPDDEIVYFLENDYLHKPDSDKIMAEGFELGADYISLYDCPDKYLDPSRGGNPYCEGGAEDTRVYLSESCHWKMTNSTTMTFASKVKTLHEDEEILRKFTSESYPRDFEMFLALRDKGRSLLTPIPGYSTHGETRWLTPLCQWEKIVFS
jgi:hypothetical protein